jgi:hypothetical protein
MPKYDIFYFNADGKLAKKIVAECADEREAKILAHAMMEKGIRRIKVRAESDERLVYERPLTSLG